MMQSATSDLLALPSAQAVIVTQSHFLAASALLGCSGSQMILQALCDDAQHWHLVTHHKYQFPTKKDQGVLGFTCSSTAATCNIT